MIIDLQISDISTTLVAVDEQDNVVKVEIYNLNTDNDSIEEIFEIGCRFSIINPKLRSDFWL